jgi:hypothetical protein
MEIILNKKRKSKDKKYCCIIYNLWDYKEKKKEVKLKLVGNIKVMEYQKEI